MKRFRSSLTRWVRLREQVERQARWDLVRARQEADFVDGLLQQGEQAARNRAEMLASRFMDAADVAVLQQAALELDRHRGDLERVRQYARSANELVDAALTAYQTARREHEVVDRALTRQQAEYRRQTLRRTTEDLHEHVIQQQFRRPHQGPGGDVGHVFNVPSTSGAESWQVTNLPHMAGGHPDA